MKEGLTLNEMAAEITRQNSMKEDYLVDTRVVHDCLLYTSPSPRDLSTSRMPSSA